MLSAAMVLNVHWRVRGQKAVTQSLIHQSGVRSHRTQEHRGTSVQYTPQPVRDREITLSYVLKHNHIKAYQAGMRPSSHLSSPDTILCLVTLHIIFVSDMRCPGMQTHQGWKRWQRPPPPPQSKSGWLRNWYCNKKALPHQKKSTFPLDLHKSHRWPISISKRWVFIKMWGVCIYGWVIGLSSRVIVKHYHMFFLK